MDELKHDDIPLRLNAIKRVSTIALALGQERTRDELIPYLNESIDDEDEILATLAKELGGFVDYVGGPEHAYVLINPLEGLAAVEEPLVRDAATESLNSICRVMSREAIEEHFVPMVIRLAEGDWFTNRASAASLFLEPYKKVSPQVQADLIKAFGQLCGDETPMVRRAAATHLTKLAAAVDDRAVVMNDLLPLFNSLAVDDQDSVRLLAVDVLVAVAHKLGDPLLIRQRLLQQTRAFFNDKSWRVRYMVADNFVRISDIAGQDVVNSELVKAFLTLVRDNEQEVRTAIAGQIPEFCKRLDEHVVLDQILPVVHDYVVDPSQHVRAAWALQISALAPILGKENTTQHLLPMFLELLKDEFPEVRLSIISKLELVNEVVGIELLSQSLLPAITTLAEDKQWRVRLAIIEYIPLLSAQLGVEFFDDKLRDLCITWLGDAVFSIREAAALNLRKLIEVFGVSWATESIIPRVLAMADHSNYLYRMTTVFAVSVIAPVVDAQLIRDRILPTLTKLVNDPIPNIRFNVAKSYEVLAGVLKGAAGSDDAAAGPALLASEIRPQLEKLAQDGDVDVRFFANRALEAIA